MSLVSVLPCSAGAGPIGEAGASAVAERIPNGLTSLSLDFAECYVREGGARAVAERIPTVAESQPWSAAEWAVALRFDNPRATVLVLSLG